MADKNTDKYAWNATSTAYDGSKIPMAASKYSNQRGVIDYGNLAQFAPFESGYAFLAVLAVPKMMTNACTGGTDVDGRQQLLDIFVSILEKEFKSFSGIPDMNGDPLEISDNITSMQLLSKTTMDTSITINLRAQEKSGAPVTKFISTFLRYLHDPKTQAKTYGGYAISQAKAMSNDSTVVGLVPGFENEVFTLLYGVTDSSMLNVEKGYIITNAQPVTANFADLYEYERGDIQFKDLQIQMNGFLIDGEYPNKVAQSYIDAMVNNTKEHSNAAGKINVNSFAMDWSYTDNNGDNKHISKLADRKEDDWNSDYSKEDGWKSYFG